MKVFHDLQIVKKTIFSAEHFLLELKAPEKLPDILPGQFAQVLIENSTSVFLRRPFSIHNVNYDENTISFFIKIAGKGTETLSYIEEGDYLNVIYPLGNSFTVPATDNILLVGGGCGVAPLLYFAKYLSSKNIYPSILIGGRTSKDIHESEQYQKYGRLHLITEDGSLGEKGVITNHSVFTNEKFTHITACGPEPMLKAIAKFAQQQSIECEVSLEHLMACGIGACLCCVVQTKQGNECVCTKGPVFNINNLSWQI